MMMVIWGIMNIVKAATFLSLFGNDTNEDTPITELYSDSIHNSQVTLNNLLLKGIVQAVFGNIAIVCNGLAIDTAWKGSRPNLLIPWLVESVVYTIVLLIVAAKQLAYHDYAIMSVSFFSAGIVSVLKVNR